MKYPRKEIMKLFVKQNIYGNYGLYINKKKVFMCANKFDMQSYIDLKYNNFKITWKN
jgi:hypothetical protein